MNNKKEIELWKSKEGEWCWFKNTNIELGRVISIEDDGDLFYTYKNLDGEKRGSYKVLEPFIGKLPTFLKEKK